jgi:hypothetical protein
MKSEDSAIKPWSPEETAIIPKSSEPDQIVVFASPQLTKRDMQSIVSAFSTESYEMVSAFVWTKAAAVLKKQISKLGMEFVGEMLGRPDLKEDSDPATSIADHEAIALAEDLGMITSTQALRLKHSLELVTHFVNLEQREAEADMMQREEALSLLKSCIYSILSHPNFEGAIRFADFRKALSERTLKTDDRDVLSITEGPYFFKRTTLGVLLSLIKTGKGAAQEHAVGNFLVLLPKLWQGLREPEKWQIGQAYAEVNAEGNRTASTGLKTGLLRVHGFDFVPESLRSNTFTEAAARVLSAHFGFNNYYNEEEPMSVLSNLGTAIPRPAFAKCMEATLAVWLGNYWGHSWAAERSAGRVLESLRREQWEYYLNQCLRRDRTVLDKLVSENSPIGRWIDLSLKQDLGSLDITDSSVRRLVEASVARKPDLVKQHAEKLRKQVRD